MQQVKPNIYQQKLGEKTTLFMIPQKSSETITLRYIFDRGSVHDPQDKQGLTNLVQRLSQKKTKNYDSQYQLMRALEEKGAIVNTGTSKETHGFKLHLTDEKILPDALRIFNEIVYQPRFNKELLKKEVELIKQDWAQLKDNPRDWVSVVTIAKLWEDSPYGVPSLGKMSHLENITAEDLKTHHTAMRQNAHLYIGLAGNLNPKGYEAGDLTKLFLKATTRNTKTLNPKGSESVALPKPSEEAQFAVEQRDIQQNNLWIAFPTVGQEHNDYYQIELLSWVLGKGFLSRFFDTIRTQNSLAYYFYSNYNALRSLGVFYLLGGVPANSLEKVFAESWRQVEDVQTGGLQNWELERGFNYYTGNLARSLEKSDNLLSFVLGHYMSRGEILTFDEYKEKLSQITLEDLQEMTKTIVQPENATVGLVGPATSQLVKKAWG